MTSLFTEKTKYYLRTAEQATNPIRQLVVSDPRATMHLQGYLATWSLLWFIGVTRLFSPLTRLYSIFRDFEVSLHRGGFEVQIWLGSCEFHVQSACCPQQQGFIFDLWEEIGSRAIPWIVLEVSWTLLANSSKWIFFFLVLGFFIKVSMSLGRNTISSSGLIYLN